jgi:hypothetical protein
MKKMLICVVFLVFTGLSSQADDLKTKDGKVYKDVKFFSVNPSGIDISYKHGKETFLRHVFFENLSEAIQKKFHYSPKKAAIYRHNLHKIHEVAVKKYEKFVKEQNHKSAEQHALESRLEAGAVNVVLKITASKSDGVVAYASSPQCSVTTGHFGKVFVYGMSGMSGGEVGSVIYPTGTSKYGYSCYAASLDMAVILASKN